MSKLFLILFITALSTLPVTTSANQGCTYNGQLYPEGSVIGPYICRNGRWVR